MTALGRVLTFAVLYTVAMLAYLHVGRGAAQTFAIEQLTVRPAVGVLAAVVPSLRAVAAGDRLAAPGGGLVVRGGCEGIDAVLLLACALLVAPLPWAHRLAGVAVGIAWLWLVNLARVLALFAAWRLQPAWFEWLHGLVLPLAALAAAALFILLWSRWSRRRARA